MQEPDLRLLLIPHVMSPLGSFESDGKPVSECWTELSAELDLSNPRLTHDSR